MEPAVTGWPSNLFTPRRLPLLSRPLRLLPPAFLCAIFLYLYLFGALLTLDRYALYGQTGVCLAVSESAPVVCLCLVQDREELLAPYLPLELGQHLDAVHRGRTDGELAAFTHGQDIGQLNGGAFPAGETLHVNDVAGAYPVLLTTCSYYRIVHIQITERILYVAA